MNADHPEPPGPAGRPEPRRAADRPEIRGSADSRDPRHRKARRSGGVLAAVLGALLVTLVASSAVGPATVRAQEAASLGRVLVVNDDGIDSPGLHALASAFAAVGRVTVVAPDGERSGSGMTSLIATEHELEARRVELAGGHEAYSIDGYPVDCVLFAVHVVFGGKLPDLLVSGINTVPNLGGAAHVSGTLGAARMARRLGIPALAVSGFDERIPGQTEAAARYAVALARSPLFSGLGPFEYLTLDVPLVPPDEFRGVRTAPRHQDSFTLQFDDSTPPLNVGDRRRYRIPWVAGSEPPAGSDVALFRQNFLIVGVMSIHSQVGDGLSVPGTDGHPLPPLEEALGEPVARGRR